MKFTLSWLKEHLDTTATVDEIAETLTQIGLEVEEVFNPASRLDGFVTAKVEKQGLGKKITVFKYKAKTNYRRKYGHRQPYTRLVIESINA